jgi:hypothetical protein
MVRVLLFKYRPNQADGGCCLLDLLVFAFINDLTQIVAYLFLLCSLTLISLLFAINYRTSDDSTHDTVFSTQSGMALILRVHLSSSREGAAPVMSLVGVKASHPWLDSSMKVIGFSAISNETNWKSSGIKLGNAVTDVVQHFQLNPPVILKVTDPVIDKLQRQQQAKTHSRNNSRATPPPPPEEVFHVDLPPIPSFFSDIHSMASSEIKLLLEDETAFKRYMSVQHSVTRVDNEQAPLLQKNIKQAEQNLSKEKQLDAPHSELVFLKAGLTEKMNQFESLQTIYNTVCTPEDTRIVIQKLHAAKRQAFNDTEKLAANWVDDGVTDMDAETFVKHFMKERTVFHTRAAKVELLVTMESSFR